MCCLTYSACILHQHIKDTLNFADPPIFTPFFEKFKPTGNSCFTSILPPKKRRHFGGMKQRYISGIQCFLRIIATCAPPPFNYNMSSKPFCCSVRLQIGSQGVRPLQAFHTCLYFKIQYHKTKHFFCTAKYRKCGICGIGGASLYLYSSSTNMRQEE